MGCSNSRKKLWSARESDGLCVYCGKGTPEHGRKGCKTCLTKKVASGKKSAKKNPTAQKQYHLLVKHDVINKYGGECVCCGESEPLFLTIDHINNNGKTDRIGTYSTKSFYLKLRREPVRPDLQVLCWSCNLGKLHNDGVCPHVEIKRTLLPEFDKRHIPVYNRNTKIAWPNDDVLIEMCNRTNTEEVARKLGVHGTSIRNRLKRRKKYHLIKKMGQV